MLLALSFVYMVSLLLVYVGVSMCIALGVDTDIVSAGVCVGDTVARVRIMVLVVYLVIMSLLVRV